MKTFFKIIGVICIVIVLGCAGLAGYGYLSYKNDGAEVEKETQALAVEYIKAISSLWNPDEAIKRSHPTLSEEMKKNGQSWQDLFKIYQKLGKLKSDVSCQLVNFRSNVGLPTYTLADYNCNAEYENGHGTISIELVKDSDSQGSFQITTLRIDSPLFTKLLEK